MTKTTADQHILRATTGVVLAVAGFAAAVSYSHIYDLARAHGQNVTAARLLPLSVDGLILAASFLILHEARAGREAPTLARCMVGLGVAATVGANVLYGLHGGTLAAIVSAWPAVSFIGSAEMLMYLIRVSRTRRAVPAKTPVVPHSVPEPSPRRVPARIDATPGRRTLEEEFAAEIAAGRVPGIKRIQRRMGGSQDTAYKHQERLRELLSAA